MSQPDDFDDVDPVLPPPLDLAKWRKLPGQLMAVGGLVAVVGAAVGYFRHGDFREFGYAWLLAFMFAFAGGAILAMLATSMMPEAYETAGRVVGLVVTLGFAVSYGITWVAG